MTPIVFIRQFHPTGGHFPGTPIAISTAKHWNPKGRVILIGDDHQKPELKALAEFHEMEKYSMMLKELKRLWPYHQSPDAWFLFASLSNYVVLAEFVIHNGLPFVAVFDTDVLLFDDIEKAVETWKQVDIGACSAEGTMQAPTLLTREALEEFASFIIRMYSPGHERGFSELVKSESKCAMSAWRHFCEANKRFKFGNLCDVTDGFTYDHNLGMKYGNYEFGDGGRILHWRNGQPYGTRRQDGITDYPRFVNLHCWSQHKQKMADYVRRSEESMR
jgi:hypothetical protein